jgi:predicted NBD/HSP70 family sugar kinase
VANTDVPLSGHGAASGNLGVQDDHPLFTALLDDLAGPAHLGWDAFGRILTRVLISGKPVAQVEIAKGAMLARARPMSATTVSRGTKELVAVGLLSDETNRSRGRPTPALVVGSKHWAVIGVHLGHRDGAVHEIVAVTTDLGSGSVLDKVSDQDFDEAGCSDPSAVLEHVADLVNALTDRASEQGRYVLGVGVEIGGQVYHGSILAYSNASFSSADFARRLSEKLPVRIPTGRVHLGRDVLRPHTGRLLLPTVLENDVNALAVQRAYHRSGSRNFAVVAVFHEGVGGAIIRDGRLVRGSRGAAAEIGHLFAEYREDKSKDGKPDLAATRGNSASHPRFDDTCPCGEYGHVQCFATPSRIMSELGRDKAADLSEAVKTFMELASSPSWANGELTEVGSAFRTAGRALGRGLVQFLTSTDPGELVLLLPYPLVAIEEGTSAWEYRDAIESELDHGFSTTRQAARRGGDALVVESLARLPNIGERGAAAAATCVVDAFIDHARGRDGCEPPRDNSAVPYHDSGQANRPAEELATVTDIMSRKPPS